MRQNYVKFSHLGPSWLPSGNLNILFLLWDFSGFVQVKGRKLL